MATPIMEWFRSDVPTPSNHPHRSSESPTANAQEAPRRTKQQIRSLSTPKGSGHLIRDQSSDMSFRSPTYLLDWYESSNGDHESASLAFSDDYVNTPNAIHLVQPTTTSDHLQNHPQGPILLPVNPVLAPLHSQWPLDSASPWVATVESSPMHPFDTSSDQLWASDLSNTNSGDIPPWYEYPSPSFIQAVYAHKAHHASAGTQFQPQQHASQQGSRAAHATKGPTYQSDQRSRPHDQGHPGLQVSSVSHLQASPLPCFANSPAVDPHLVQPVFGLAPVPLYPQMQATFHQVPSHPLSLWPANVNVKPIYTHSNNSRRSRLAQMHRTSAYIDPAALEAMHCVRSPRIRTSDRDGMAPLVHPSVTIVNQLSQTRSCEPNGGRRTRTFHRLRHDVPPFRPSQAGPGPDHNNPTNTANFRHESDYGDGNKKSAADRLYTEKLEAIRVFVRGEMEKDDGSGGHRSRDLQRNGIVLNTSDYQRKGSRRHPLLHTSPQLDQSDGFCDIFSNDSCQELLECVINDLRQLVCDKRSSRIIHKLVRSDELVRALIVRGITMDCVGIVMDKTGSLFVQKLVCVLRPEELEPLAATLCSHARTLVNNCYANYVLTKLISITDYTDSRGRYDFTQLVDDATAAVIDAVEPDLEYICDDKFGSPVIEAVIKFGSPATRRRIEEFLLMNGQSSDRVVEFMRLEYANYVVQTSCDHCTDPGLTKIFISAIREAITTNRCLYNGSANKEAFYAKMLRKYDIDISTSSDGSDAKILTENEKFEVPPSHACYVPPHAT